MLHDRADALDHSRVAGATSAGLAGGRYQQARRRAHAERLGPVRGS